MEKATSGDPSEKTNTDQLERNSRTLCARLVRLADDGKKKRAKQAEEFGLCAQAAGRRQGLNTLPRADFLGRRTRTNFRNTRRPGVISANGPQFIGRDFRHDPRPNLAVLPAIDQKSRALAQIAKTRVHPGRDAAVAAVTNGPEWRPKAAWTTKQCPSEQLHRLHHARKNAGGTAAGDPRRTRPQALARSLVGQTATSTIHAQQGANRTWHRRPTS